MIGNWCWYEVDIVVEDQVVVEFIWNVCVDVGDVVGLILMFMSMLMLML